MRPLLSCLLAVLLVVSSTFFGCKKDDPSSPGTGAAGGVTFQVTVVQNQGLNYFRLTPSTAVTVTQVIITQAGQQPQTLTGDGTTVYTAQAPPEVQVNNLATGQQWAFAIQGKIGNAQGAAYSATSNFVVP